MKPFQSWLLDRQDEMANDLEQLCNLNSGSDNVEGLARVADWLVEYFSPFEVECERIELPSFQIIDDLGAMRSKETGSALRWNLPGSNSGKKRRLLLTIHYDTVYGPDNHFQLCERFEAKGPNGQSEMRMRGPGVIDAKGGIVVLRWAVLAARKFMDLSSVDLSVVLTPDEEIGSPASIDLWKKIGGDFDFAMLFEPAMADGALVSTRKGTGTFVFVIRGKSAHAGRNLHEGRNAVNQACKLALALDALNGQRPDVTINIGRIRGGDAVNVVPDLAVLRVNVRVTSQEDQVWVAAQVQHIVHSYSMQESGIRVELHGGIQASPKAVDESVRIWMQWVEQAGEQIGESISWKGSGGASDGNKLAALGLPNIDTFGPEGDLLHSDQEWVRLSSLPRKAALSAAVIATSSRSD
jgi:glutamate carboxypeptidase